MNERIVDVILGDALRAEATDGKHVVVFDEPIKDGGTDTGPTPVQVFLSALGSCSVITMRMYARRKGWDLIDAKAKVRLVRPEPGRAFTPRITQEITLEGDLDETQRARLLQIAGRCSVHRLVDGPLETEERFARPSPP